MAPNEALISDFAAMDGGKFFIGAKNKNILIELLARKQATGDFKFGLVPNISDKTIFFADIDGKAAFDVELFTNALVSTFNRFVMDKVKELKYEDVILTQREDGADHYHAYIPFEFGQVTKAARKRMWAHINKIHRAPIIDEAANTIRIEGFEKWDRVNNRFKRKSRYLPLGAAANLPTKELLHKIWLKPRGWLEQDEYEVLDLANVLHAADEDDNKDRESQAIDSSANSSSLESLSQNVSMNNIIERPGSVDLNLQK